MCRENRFRDLAKIGAENEREKHEGILAKRKNSYADKLTLGYS